MSLSNDDTKLLRAVGQKIRSLRVELKLSQAQLADFACMSARYLGEIEAGKRNVSLANLHKLANHLSVTTAELIDIGDMNKERKAEVLEEIQMLLVRMSVRQLLSFNRLLRLVVKSLPN